MRASDIGVTTGNWRYAKRMVNAVRVGQWVRLTRAAQRGGGIQGRARSPWGRVTAKHPPVGLCVVRDGLRQTRHYYAGVWSVPR